MISYENKESCQKSSLLQRPYFSWLDIGISKHMFAEHPRVFNKKILKTPEWKISISNFPTNSFFKARHTFYDPVIGTFLFLQVRSMEAETKQENKKKTIQSSYR